MLQRDLIQRVLQGICMILVALGVLGALGFGGQIIPGQRSLQIRFYSVCLASMSVSQDCS